MTIYVSQERVTRDGRLVAFKGEVMSMEEAHRRGLINDETAQDETQDETQETPDLGKLKKPELLALCEERGIPVPGKTTIDQLIELLSE